MTHITLHIMIGYLAGTDSTFANSASQASAHYGIGADGTIHQYVSERDGSYSDANLYEQQQLHQHRARGRHGPGRGLHPGMHRRQRTPVRGHRPPLRLGPPVARRHQGNIWLHREIPGTDHAGCPDLAPNGLPYQQVIDKANAILKGENMSVAEVTDGLYQAKGNDGRNIFDSVIQTRNELKDRAADASTQPRATTGGTCSTG